MRSRPGAKNASSERSFIPRVERFSSLAAAALAEMICPDESVMIVAAGVAEA